ncbi:MAG TPA: TIGR03621 family F420-dependent LLM class oxidoreductase [Thermomicrobiales bacterium]|nr:TIGR03621 family F420-dependent LLM class oxidoreductase [Thermomicrobiales bacterium]
MHLTTSKLIHLVWHSVDWLDRRTSLIELADNLMSGTQRPFRFGIQFAGTRTRGAGARTEWTEQARKAEALGYDILVMPDHLGGQFAIGSALAVVAEATTALRIGTLVLQNDLRHPALVAMEAATLDVLSDGRFEIGLGAGGSFMPDYEWTGIPFDPPGTRVGRLEESLLVIKGLFAEGPVTFTGQHYTITDLEGQPKPIQEPHPPILIGGGGPRMLSLAAREADIVSILAPMLPGGGQFRMEGSTAAAVSEQVELIRRAAGTRFPAMELNILLQRLVVTEDVRQAREDLSREWVPLTPEEVGETPYLLIGTVDEIVATLQARRDHWGISYVVVFGEHLDAFAPVVAELAGR